MVNNSIQRKVPPKIIDRVSRYIGEATGSSVGGRALAEELQSFGYLVSDEDLPGPWKSVEEAQKHGVNSGTLMNGDTFGDEDDETLTNP